MKTVPTVSSVTLQLPSKGTKLELLATIQTPFEIVAARVIHWKKQGYAHLLNETPVKI
jgi:hypothetical protein